MSYNYPRRGQIIHVGNNGMAKPVGSEIWPNRPAIIVSNNVCNKLSNVIQIVYLTASNYEKKVKSPTHVAINSYKKPSIAICEQIDAIDKTRITAIYDFITKKELSDVELGICYNLNLQIEQSLNDPLLNNKNLNNLIEQIELLTEQRDSYKNLYSSIINKKRLYSKPTPNNIEIR